MDDGRFDALARHVGEATDRRRVVKTLAAGMLGTVGAWFGLHAPGAEAGCNRTGRRCKRNNDCCSRRCRKRNGRCLDCKRGTKLCGERCIPDDACCEDGECSGGMTCQDQSCACPANAPTNCLGTCRNLSNDDRNCGGCTNVCQGGRICQSSICRCPFGQIVCNGTCVNLDIDDRHCSACGNACGSGQFCCGGVCRANSTCRGNGQTCGSFYGLLDCDCLCCSGSWIGASIAGTCR